MSSDNPIPASVTILTCNSAATLPRTLDSVCDFQQVIVLDSGSTDQTLEIARQYGAEIHHQSWLGFARQKAHAQTLCRHDWVLDLDSDEAADERLVSDIRHLLANESHRYQGLNVAIHDVFLDATTPRGMRLNRRIKFYRRGLGHYALDKLVHESIRLNGAWRNASGLIWHSGLDGIDIKLDKIRRYATLRAEEKWQAGKRTGLLRLLLATPLAFVRSYLLRRRCLAGRSGLIDSALNAFYAFLKQAKLYERQCRERQRMRGHSPL